MQAAATVVELGPGGAGFGGGDGHNFGRGGVGARQKQAAARCWKMKDADMKANGINHNLITVV